MRIIQALDAASELPNLLDEVERGETVIVEREGRAIARVVPETSRNQQQIERAVEEIKKLRKTASKVSVEELLDWRHEGHRY